MSHVPEALGLSCKGMWSMVNNRCSVHQACPFLAVTWPPDSRELCATLGQGELRWGAVSQGLCLPACLLSPPHVQMGTSGLGCLLSVDTG